MSDPYESPICAGCIAAFDNPAIFLEGDAVSGRRRVESIETALRLDMINLVGPDGRPFGIYARTTIEGTAFCLDCARRVLAEVRQPPNPFFAPRPPWQLP